ncbi:Ig domain-containing protein [Acetobacterium wieringae]|nr:Ig domain-containing protein [Acetobacterium wieringae]
MEKKFMRRVATGVLLLMLVLSIFSSSSVLAANEAAGKAVPEEIGVAYRGHVQNQGNMPKPEGSLVSGPEALGTRGQSLRVEGFWIQLTGNVPEGANIVYEVHVQNEGWMAPVKNGNFAGTAGKSQRVESIKIRLENLPGYDVYYRGHVQNVGDIPQVDGDWGWKKNGEELGTTGSSLRLEELQVKLVKQPDTSTTYDKAGTYGPKTGVDEIENDVLINTPDVILQNLHIKGNLTIGEGVGEGDVTLNNITVDGETFVRGGGKNSIHINGGDYNKITIQQTSSGQVRIVATDAAGLEVVVSEDAKGEDIILEGAFENVLIDAPDVKISTQGETAIKEMVVAEGAKGSEITLDKKTVVNQIDVGAAVEMKGEGTIEKANVNSDNVTFEQKPKEVVIAPEVKVPPVVAPPTPPKPDPTPSSPPAEDQIVKTFNQEKSTDMMVNLLEAHASAFDLTDFDNLDYLGRLIVGDYLLKKDGFANRSVLQAAITEGIKLAKDDPEARRYIEAALAYSPSISFQETDSLLLDYSNPLLSGAQKSLLNGQYADFLVCLETPLADGEAFEINLSGTTKRITNKEMPGREILLSKLMGRTLGSADLVENQKARLVFTVKDISIKAEQYLTLYPCTTRNGDEYCRNFSNAHSIRVTRYWINAFADGLSLDYRDSKFSLNYGKTYTTAVKQQLDTCCVDLKLQLYRPLESAESITITVNGLDYTIDATTVMDDNQTGIHLSKLTGIAPGKASELNGELVVGLKSCQLNTPNGIDASAVLCGQNDEFFYTLSGAGTSLYPDWLKSYMDSVALSCEENKMTLDYDGNLSQAVCDHLGDYRADVIISLSRELDEGETLTITAFEKTKCFTPAEIAALGENGSQLRLSKLMGVDPSLAKSEVGKNEITFTLSGLNRNIYIYSQAVLVKEDTYIYLDGLSNSLSLFEASFQAYADSIDLQSQENTFTVTYTGNLAADVKSKLTGYYADAMIYIDRPLKEGEEISVSAFGKDIPVSRETFNNVWGTWIRLSELLELELGAEQLAVNQKGSFEIKVNEKSLSEQLNISASAILVKGTDIEYLSKSAGMSLLPKASCII